MFQTRGWLFCTVLRSALFLLASASHVQSHPFPKPSVFPSVRIVNRTYDEARARTAYAYATAGYCNSTAVNSWNCSACKATGNAAFEAVYFEDLRTDTHGYVGGSPEVIAVAFRGSEDTKNWIKNLEASKTTAYNKCDGCRVHSGFLSCWRAVKGNVTALVKDFQAKYPKAEVQLAGHSLGAALVVLAAAHLYYEEGIDVRAVTTFGLPRVGNKAFQRFYNEAPHVSWRLTHWKDPVPHLPPRSLGFHHIATEVFYNQGSSEYKVCSSEGEDPTCSNSLWVDTSVTDHLNYLGSHTGIDACADPVWPVPSTIPRQHGIEKS